MSLSKSRLNQALDLARFVRAHRQGLSSLKFREATKNLVELVPR